MVAVKSLWVLWKNFSTNFSFSNLASTVNNNNNNDTYDSKHVKYNRLRTFEKSISSHFPLKSSSSITSFNCLRKSASSYDSNGNNNNNNSSSLASPNNNNGSSSSSTGGKSHIINPSEIGWNYALDNSDTEFEDGDCDGDDDDDESLDEYRMRTTPDDVSDFDDEDEALTCDVCDRSFPTLKRLADHQYKKRHYGCLQCDSIFPSKEALEDHREQMDHYDFVSDYESETTSFESDDDEDGIENDGHDEEERERLL